MKTTKCTQHPEIQAILSELRLAAAQNPTQFQRSVLKDAQGLQYVDIVMEGGGTLGLGLLGYLYVLEEMGFRFLQIAGTSAGSIAALLLAAGPIEEARTPWILDKMANQDFSAFLDGDEAVQEFTENLLDESASKAKKLRYSGQVAQDVKTFYGLHPGQVFYQWLADTLAEKGIATLADLRRVRAKAPEGLPCPPQRWERVAFVTADVTTGTKIAFPEQAALYWQNPDRVNPALFVRASMSVPLFFYPLKITGLPTGPEARQRWANVANYHGPIPSQALFIDGGALSNFPLSLLRPDGQNQDAPLFAIKLGQDRNTFNTCDTIGGYAGAVLSAMMGFYDNDYFVRYPHMRHCVGVIDTGEHHWLDFYMDDSEKVDLFVRGARAAAGFLSNSK